MAGVRPSVPVDGVAASLGRKRRLAGERVAYEQRLHDQIEFTHLSSFGRHAR